MSTTLKKQLILNLPYIILGLVSTKIPQAIRLAEGSTASETFYNLGMGFSKAFEVPLPSFYPTDLLIGIMTGCSIRLIVYNKGKNAKKYRQGIEYGSARWGNAKDIEEYKNPIFKENVILTQTELLTMNSRPQNPKTARNKNVLIIGGSGSGKTRFWLKPNLMQCHSSYVVTDPKGYT